MNFTGVDIGASQTRIISDTARVGVNPNNAVIMDNVDEVTSLVPYNDELENALEVKIEKHGDSNMFPLRVLYGTMAERYSRTNIRPSVQERKYRQKISYASLITAVACSRIKFGTVKTGKLYIAVPPVEVAEAEKAFKEELVGNFTVYLPKFQNGGTTVDIEITDVVCYGESYLSTVSFFFDTNAQIKQDHAKYLNGVVLSINIGASTTDLAVVKNGQYLDKSGKTLPVGGNMARDFLIGAVQDKYEFDLPVENAEKAMAEGRLQIGNKYVDIKDLVSAAKDELAKDIVGRMEYYFKQINIPIQTMNGMIVSGGGSLQSQYVEDGLTVKTSEPMSVFVTDRLKGWCDTVEVVEYGDEARLADVKGLYILATLDKIKEEKLAGAVTPQA